MTTNLHRGELSHHKTDTLQPPCIGCEHVERCTRCELACRDFYEFTRTNIDDGTRQSGREPNADIFDMVYG